MGWAVIVSSFEQIKRYFLWFIFFTAIATFILTPYLLAHASDPGWQIVTAPLVSPENARKILKKDIKLKEKKLKIPQSEIIPFSMAESATEITPEIEELARGLKYDLKLIYEYVHNHIDYVPYFGSLKGATLTLLERCGNDFDQASLMVALLNASGYSSSTQYVYGEMTIPTFEAVDNHDLQHWLGVDADTSVIATVLGSGGIPATVNSSQTTMDRVWIKVTVDENEYIFDPAFKIYEKIPAIDLAGAMGYDQATLLDAVGGETGTDYIRNLNESNLNTKLVEYTNNLIDFLRTNYPNASVEEIIGGRKIIPEYLTEYPANLQFSNTPLEYWETIPDTYIHKVHIQHGDIDEVFDIPEIAGKRLAITYDMPIPMSSSMMNLSNASQGIPDKQGPITVTNSFNLTPDNASITLPVGSTPSMSSPEVEQLENNDPMIIMSGSADFGKIYPDGWREMIFKPKNSNSVTVQVIVSLVDNSSGAFSIREGGGSHNLAPNQVLNIVIRCSGVGQSPGYKTARLRMEWWYNGSRFADDYTNLSGTIAHKVNLDGSYGYNFGQCYLNTPREGTCQLNNNGSLTLTINSITITGPDSSRFQIISGGGSGSISPGGHRDIDVRYLANALGTHNATIHIDFTYDGLPYDGDILSLVGETISKPLAQLWLEDEVVAFENNPSSSEDTMILTVDHPYAANSGNYADQTATYNFKRGSTYVIISDFGGSKTGLLLKKRQQMLEKYKMDGHSDSSPQVLCETLNIIGQNWMEQTTLNSCLITYLTEVLSIRHHRFGVTAQEEGYYIDVKAQLGSITSKHNDNVTEDASFKAHSHLASALEHGVLEQLQIDRPAASTMKLLQLANAGGDKIFFVNSANYSAIEPELFNYDEEDRDEFQNLVNDGATLILPSNGQIVLEEWKGMGYIRFEQSGTSARLGMIIGGDYYGGYGGYKAPVKISDVKTEFVPELKPKIEKVSPKSIEPVDLVTGAYLFDSEDISLGDIEPKGLRFSRSYNSNNYYRKTVLNHGWSHNYDIYLSKHSDGESGLGLRQPIDTASLLVASMVTIDLMKGDPDVKDWVTSALIAKWAMDQLTNNAISVHMNSKVLTFIKLPDDTYSPPPGVTTRLLKETDLFRLEERFGTKIYFNSDNKITSWQNADENTMTFIYAGDKLTTIQDCFSRTLTLQYTGDLLTLVSDSTGRSIYYGYDANDDLISYTDPEGKVWGYGYDAYHRMTSLNNPLEVITAINTYDKLGRVDTQTVPRQGGVNATYHFYFSDYRNIEEDPDGNTTIYYFDYKGRTIGEEDALGYRTIKEYDGQNHLISVTDALGHTTHFTYDGHNNLIKQTDPLGYETTFSYDTQHRLKSTTDPLGNLTQYLYDEEHHLILTIDAYDNQTVYTYYENGLLHTTTDANEDKTISTYDSYGNPAAVEMRDSLDSLQSKITYTFNHRGDMESINDTKGTYQYTYDKRRLKISQIDPLNYTSTYDYDDAGNLINTKTETGDPANPWQTNVITYTPTGEKESVTDPQSHTTNYQYDQHDRLVKTINAENKTTEYRYDPIGRIHQVIDALGNISQEHTYTPTGKKESIKDAKGNITQYEYDDNDRLIKATYPDTNFEGFAYDEVGNQRQKRTRSGANIDYEYDDLNRIKTKILPGPIQIQYSYDSVGRLENITATGGDIHHDYDGAGRLIRIIYPDSKTVEYTYDTAGNRTRLTYPDGYFITYTYDYLNRLTDVFEAGTTLLAHYDYDPLSRRVTVTYANGSSASYIYEIDNDLLTLSNQFNTSTVTLNYTYNNIGNRIGSTVDDIQFEYPLFAKENKTYTSNELNQYTEVAEIPFSYDENGNLFDDGVNSYTYDIENRLLTATTPDHTVTYTYDPKGRRIAKTVDGITTSYLYNGQQVIMEYDDSGEMLRRYVYGPGIDEPICMITAGGEYYYYHYDVLGSVIVLSDASGSMVESYAYDPYGQVIRTSSVGNPYLYTGRRYDSEINLYYYRARYYSPELGRFLSVDPIGYEGGDLNLYAYVRNNPVMWVDPFGRLAFWYHFQITLNAALEAGLGIKDSFGLAWDALMADFAEDSGEKGWEATRKHAMAGELPPGGDYQSPKEAIKATNEYIIDSINSDNLGGAIHAAQDLATPGHAGKKWYGYKLNWETAKHLLGDAFPSQSTINQAYQKTKNILTQAKQMTNKPPKP